jgi:hypothetical protein
MQFHSMFYFLILFYLSHDHDETLCPQDMEISLHVLDFGYNNGKETHEVVKIPNRQTAYRSS